MKVEKNYFDLLVAQCELVAARSEAKKIESKQMIASNGAVPVITDEYRSELIQADKVLVNAESKVKELTASMNEMLGWAEETQLETSPTRSAGRANLIAGSGRKGPCCKSRPHRSGAECRKGQGRFKAFKIGLCAGHGGDRRIHQSKCRATSAEGTFLLSVLWFPTTYLTLGRREHTVKERTAQREMAEIAVQTDQGKTVCEA